MIQYVLYAIALIAVIGGYWWWTSGRHGSRATHVHLGLRPDEEIKFLFSGFFKINFKASDIALAVVGVERVGKSFHITITTGNELILKPNGDPPQRFRKGMLKIARVKENEGKLAGIGGKNESADIYEITLSGQDPFHVQLAHSAGDQIIAWST